MNDANDDNCGERDDCARTPAEDQATPMASDAANPVAVFRISTMDCATEESEIRRALDGVPGVRGVQFQLAARTLSIDASRDSIALAVNAIRALGFDPQPVLTPLSNADHPYSPAAQLWKPGSALVLAMAAELVAILGPATLAFGVAEMFLAAVAIGLAGMSTYRKGCAALMQGRLNMNALMSVAVTGAFLIGQWPEAAMVMALFAIAELIEARAVDRARNAISGLLDLAPDSAEVRTADGLWHEAPAADIHPGAEIRVKPGVRIALDGVVISGDSSVNQAPVTGESISVDKQTGDEVYAGTINETGILEIRVTASAANSTLARIIHAVEQAQGTRAPTQQFVDRFASIYTPAVFALAVAVAMLTPWLFGWSWTQALYKALVLLVIACPCALVIATPVTIVSGLALAARRGILIKGGVYLETAHKLKVIALDKTGTITTGRPTLVHSERVTNEFAEQQVMQWAAGLAAHSDHPVSKAIAEGLGQSNTGLSDLVALPGRGIQARIDGVSLVLANHRLVEERGLCSPDLEARLAVHEAQGRTMTMLASQREVLAVFAVADTIKEGSRAALAELHSLGVASIMLSGDNETTAREIARQAGIDDVRGNLLPEEKLDAITELCSRNLFTAMVGDGINDAPSLARADLGIAMGGVGTDIAMEAADIVIMNDDLRRIPETIRLSRRTRTVLWQNIVFAVVIKGAFLLLAIFGNVTMWMAVFADMGASLIVVMNGLRLLQPIRTHSCN